MQITWEAIAAFLLSGAIASAAWWLRRMIKTIDELEQLIQKMEKCMAINQIWREQHDKRHSEVGERRESDRAELWVAINQLRDKR